MSEHRRFDISLRRRELLKASLALAAAGPAAASLAGAARAAGEGVLGGAEVKALFVGDPFAQASQRVIGQLNEMAGGTISMQVVDFNSMHQKILLDAPSANPAFDVYSWEFSWLGEMVGANALRPLDDFVERDKEMLNIDDIPKANWEATVWDGKRYGIPVQPHAELTWWRTDLLEAAGLQPPKNTDDLLAAAKALHNPDEGVYGFLWKGGRGAPLGPDHGPFVRRLRPAGVSRLAARRLDAGAQHRQGGRRRRNGSSRWCSTPRPTISTSPGTTRRGASPRARRR